MHLTVSECVCVRVRVRVRVRMRVCASVCTCVGEKINEMVEGGITVCVYGVGGSEGGRVCGDG